MVVPPLDALTTTGFSSTPTGSNFYGQGSGGFPSFTDMEKALGKSGGAEGSISFQPSGSDWVFNISGRYGRAHTNRRLDQRHDIDAKPGHVVNFLGSYPFTAHYTNYAIQTSDNTEAHVILDFQVGKDIGIGLFGRTESVFSFGARYAQMNMTSKGHAYAAPGVRFYGHGGINILGKYSYNINAYHQNSATVQQALQQFPRHWTIRIVEQHNRFVGQSCRWSARARLGRERRRSVRKAAGEGELHHDDTCPHRLRGL